MREVREKNRQAWRRVNVLVTGGDGKHFLELRTVWEGSCWGLGCWKSSLERPVLRLGILTSNRKRPFGALGALPPPLP